MPNSIAQLQAQVADDQADLQQANNNLQDAIAVLNEALAVSAPPNVISQLTSEAIIAATFQTQAQLALTADQAQLDAALAIYSGVVPVDPALAPANAIPPTTTNLQNNQIVTDYDNPSSSQLAGEAAEKISSQGAVDDFNSVTQGITILNANGTATAINQATGQAIISLGSVAPLVNTLPPNTLPDPSDQTESLKVIITQEPVITGDPSSQITGLGGGGINPDGNQVVLEVMPVITETRDANYRSFTPIQHPGEILKYEGSSSRSWSVQAKLVSRSADEASINRYYLNLIRSWVMPFYGTGTGGNSQTAQYLGAPPPVLTLKAYGYQMIGPVKCVLTQYQWNWPNEVDWIQAGSGDPFPVMIDISLSLRESYSPAEYTAFDLIQYRNGNLPAAFGGAASLQISGTGSNTPASPTTPQSPTTPPVPSTIDTSQANVATQAQINSGNAGASAAQTNAGAGASITPTANQSEGADVLGLITNGGA